MEANIASLETAQSFLKASRVKKTHHAHEVTAAALHVLIKKASYRKCVIDTEPFEV